MCSLDHEELLRLQGSVVGPSQAHRATSGTSSNPSSTPRHSPGPETIPGDTSIVDRTTTSTSAPTRVQAQATTNLVYPPASKTTHPPTRTHSAAGITPDDPNLPPPSPPHCVSPVRLTSQAQTPWTPTHQPSWSLGPQHNDYVHAAAPYLLGVPGGSMWEKLLTNYILFESLSSAVPVSRSACR